MKKSEQIFKSTRLECRAYIKAFGYDENIGFNALSHDVIIYKKTKNAIQKIIDRKIKELTMDLSLQVITEEKAREEKQILNNVTANEKRRVQQ